MTDSFALLDQVRTRAEAIGLQPAFDEEITKRVGRAVDPALSESDCLRELASLIAFSQSARSDAVERMIEGGKFARAFSGFDVDQVAALDAPTVISAHWSELGAMRFRKKVGSIIDVARSVRTLRDTGRGLPERLRAMPRRIQTSDDVGVFWAQFDALRNDLRDVQMPFFGQLTSLLHLLLHFGFDCIKPDLVVQKVAAAAGLLPPKPTERDLRSLVQLVQTYSVSRNTRPAVVDFFLLVDGRQTWALKFIRPGLA